MTTFKPAPLRHLHGLDHLRAFAITFVFLYHYGRIFPHPAWTNTISAFGWTGVDLFFVLSGYLIASQLFAGIAAGKGVDFPTFFIKRVFRILPAYLLTLGVYVALPSFREREALAPLWKYLTFTQNLGLDLRTQGTFSHAWSLCIEEQFYLVLPLVLIALLAMKQLRKGAWLLAFLFAGGFVLRAFCWDHFVAPFQGEDDAWVRWYTWLYYPTFCRLDGLLVGVSVAALFRFKPAVKARLQPHGNLLLLAGIAVLTAAYFTCADPESYAASVAGFPLTDLGYGSIVMGAVCQGSILDKYRTGITVRLATWSYVLYLTHKIVIHVTQNGLRAWGWDLESNATFAVCTVACLVVAWLLNRLLEKPFLRLRNRVLQKRKQPMPAAVTV
ncbi:acyltransferase [Chitinophaga parva]|uniref:Acyltransferase n=1 Tax=Chitinophaga parva TaxID=2169414 RepID=A0A2T7BP38_9BACT|nr:acyltransferase [Chitinophaga parva]PUZ29443.1 acyltransferase [Chitinophaga parva]